jgi:hypothetical protein
MDAQDGVAGVVLAAEHLTHFEVADAFVERVSLGDGLGERIGVTLDRELEENVRVVELAALLLPAVERGRQLRPLALDLLRLLVVVPEIGVSDELVERREACLGARDVKDAPEASPDAVRARPIAL